MKILWLDDEIETLLPHKIYLQRNGIDVDGVDHPDAAIQKVNENNYNLILVDFRMPGMTGIEFIKKAKQIAPNIPYVLVTMMQDADIMEDAVSEDVYDYIVKPVQPSQILAIVKRLEKDAIMEKKLGHKLVSFYKNIENIKRDKYGWLDIGTKVAYSLSDNTEAQLGDEIEDLNNEFALWISKNYNEIINDSSITHSDNAVDKFIIPEIQAGKKIALFVLDNFRFAQFIKLLKGFSNKIKTEIHPMYAILPTATIFARNSIFAGLLPFRIHEIHPDYLKNNLHEKELFKQNLSRHKIRDRHVNFSKINTLNALKSARANGDLNVFVINFIDLLSHIRNDVDSLRDIAPCEQDFTDLTLFILNMGRLSTLIEEMCERGFTTFMTTDHGWITARKPAIIEGGKDLTPSLRFKFGHSLRLRRERDGITFNNASLLGLPVEYGRAAIAKAYNFFIYPTDPVKYEKKYTGKLMHGGATLEEMIVPFIKLN